MSFLIFLVLYPGVFCFLDRQTLRCFVEDVDLSLESSSSQEKLVACTKIPGDMRVLLDRSIYLGWQVMHLEGYRGKPCCSKTHVGPCL